MSWRDARLYVETFDVALWVTERVRTLPQDPMSAELLGAAADLVDSASLALTFPADRADHLRRADEAIVRLRIRLRLAQSLGMLSEGGTRDALARLALIGKMVGGWRKRRGVRPRDSPESEEA